MTEGNCGVRDAPLIEGSEKGFSREYSCGLSDNKERRRSSKKEEVMLGMFTREEKDSKCGYK